jgi:hypothetical protein
MNNLDELKSTVKYLATLVAEIDTDVAELIDTAKELDEIIDVFKDTADTNHVNEKGE